jgi:hypothetical protein
MPTRSASCGKNVFLSDAAARREARDRQWTAFNVYRCRHCNGYHLTHGIDHLFTEPYRRERFDWRREDE